MRKLILIASVVTAFLGLSLSCSAQNNKNMKTIVIYYSLTGNTKGIAEKVAKELNADIEALEPVKPYPNNYSGVVEEGQEEVENDFKRPIKPLKHDLNEYDRIIVGSPTWWYKMASPVLTFLSDNKFDGKVVVPFMTNAGWPGTVLKDMTAIAKKNGADVRDAHSFKFNTHNDGTTTGMATSQKELTDWIQSLK
jgi:flavodoxin